MGPIERNVFGDVALWVAQWSEAESIVNGIGS